MTRVTSTQPSMPDPRIGPTEPLHAAIGPPKRPLPPPTPRPVAAWLNSHGSSPSAPPLPLRDPIISASSRGATRLAGLQHRAPVTSPRREAHLNHFPVPSHALSPSMHSPHLPSSGGMYQPQRPPPPLGDLGSDHLDAVVHGLLELAGDVGHPDDGREGGGGEGGGEGVAPGRGGGGCGRGVDVVVDAVEAFEVGGHEVVEFFVLHFLRCGLFGDVWC
ncbi:hypothetical protein QBC39DRAFT_345762 [Podospora conica]|nr:hypothetical protein QBC39DRAFT_345762 [Schizothecium conicum]